jgi:hypothetical protein
MLPVSITSNPQDSGAASTTGTQANSADKLTTIVQSDSNNEMDTQRVSRIASPMGSSY